MKFKHIVVVHGIGDQQANETVIGFMNEFIRSMPDEIRDQVDIHNLLSERIHALLKHRKNEDAPKPKQPAYLTIGAPDAPNYAIAFSEVYWQPVTNGYLEEHEQSPPIPIFTWAHSVNTRLFHGGSEYRRAREAIDNLETMLGLIRRMAAIYKKSGQLATVLAKFLGDVEMYVESGDLRDNINQRFFDILENDEVVSKDVKNLLSRHGAQADWESHDIYIVAHSEGTVVSYFSLVQAAAEREQHPHKYTWLPRVRGLVTMGTPLDKHYTIWENRFVKDNLTKDLDKKIDWYNYADRSDPVGMDLTIFKNGTDHALDPKGDAGRMFNLKFDDPFARYPIPGKAHTDYWTDREIHRDILQKVMEIGPQRTKTVKSRPWGRRWIMTSVDYVAWAVARLGTMAALIFFLALLMVPVRQNWPQIANLMSWVPRLRWLALGVLGSVILLKFLGWLQDRMKDAPLRTLQVVRTVLFIAILVAAGLRVNMFDSWYTKGHMDVKDWLGYLGCLVVTGLVWKLHTVVHKGLVQLWRYTNGWKVKSIAVYRPPVEKRAEAAKA